MRSGDRDKNKDKLRRGTGRALQQSQARTQAMLDTALDAVITMNHEGGIAEFNQLAERVFG